MLLPSSSADIGRAVTSDSGIERRYCAFDGDSFLGSRGGAKASTDFVYLGPVLDKGASVRDLSEVSAIEPLASGELQGYTVHFTDLASGRKEQVQARRVVLAAGTARRAAIFGSLADRETFDCRSGAGASTTLHRRW